mmetsp:Transcript_60843/g.166758  ORF Transcript_60843/g.166758 Transcript_60843/m.166758 type:complete len:235 (-) Transcript_60843:730-1434(-)
MRPLSVAFLLVSPRIPSSLSSAPTDTSADAASPSSIEPARLRPAPSRVFCLMLNRVPQFTQYCRAVGFSASQLSHFFRGGVFGVPRWKRGSKGSPAVKEFTTVDRAVLESAHDPATGVAFVAAPRLATETAGALEEVGAPAAGVVLHNLGSGSVDVPTTTVAPMSCAWIRAEAGARSSACDGFDAALVAEVTTGAGDAAAEIVLFVASAAELASGAVVHRGSVPGSPAPHCAAA